MKILSTSIADILSVGEIHLSFEDSGATLIDGWNADDDVANGAGKSAIFNALTFGIYGKMPRDVTATEILRKGCKSGSVTVTVDVNGDIWTVKRERPTNLVFTKNNQVENITQEAWEKILGLSYQQFLLTVYASQLKSDKFIYLNDAAKKDFLLQLMNFDKFNVAKDLAAKQVKDYQAKVIKLDTSISGVSARIQATEEYSVDEEAIHNSIVNRRLCEAGKLKEIQELELVQKPDLSKYDQVEAGIAQKRKHFNGIRLQVNTLKAERNSLLKQRKVMADFDTVPCPHCSQETVMTSNALLKASDVGARKAALEADNLKLDQAAAAISISITDLENKLSEESEIDNLEIKVKQKRSDSANDYYQAVQKISELRILKGKLEQEQKSLQKQLDDYTALKAKIATYQAELSKLQADRSQLQAAQIVAETLQTIFSPVGIQAYVADMVLDRLNERVAYYLSSLWPNATYQLLSYKENKSGETKAKFSEKIVISGREASLGSLSGGERCCISLALDLAVTDVVTQVFGVHINPLILDEPFDGMDSANRERAIEALSQLAKDKQIIVIDHASEAKALFSNVVKVIKKNGITSIST